MAAIAGVAQGSLVFNRVVQRRWVRPVLINNVFRWNLERFTSTGHLADCTLHVEVTIRWRQLPNLLPTDLNCPNCGTACREGHLTAPQIIQVFRCPDQHCRRVFSIRTNSFLIIIIIINSLYFMPWQTHGQNNKNETIQSMNCKFN